MRSATKRKGTLEKAGWRVCHAYFFTAFDSCSAAGVKYLKANEHYIGCCENDTRLTSQEASIITNHIVGHKALHHIVEELPSCMHLVILCVIILSH